PGLRQQKLRGSPSLELSYKNRLECCRSYQPGGPAVMANSIAVKSLNHKGREGSGSCAGREELFLALDQIPCDLLQRFCTWFKTLQLCEGVADQFLCFLYRGVQSKQCGISRLLGCGVLTRRFAELFRSLGDVQHVVNDLKGQPDSQSESAQVLDFALFGSAVKAASHQAGGDQGGCLGAMNVFQHLRGGLGMFRFEIDDLTADHAVDSAGAAGSLLDDFDARFGGTLQARQDFVGPRLQRVSSQNGDGLAKYLVAGRAPAAQVVIVESGQIIVDKGVRVQHLQCRTQFLDTDRQ